MAEKSIRNAIFLCGLMRRYGTEGQYLKRVGVLGVPFGLGQGKGGVEYGPQALRCRGLIQILRNIAPEDVVIRDYGDVHYEPAKDCEEIEGMRNYEHVSACIEQVSRKATNILNQGCMCLTIGGDHTIAVGTINAHVKVKKDVCVVWVDAHADMNTCDSSNSGNIHGMAAALSLKELMRYWPPLPNMDWQYPRLSVDNIVYIGLRDLDAVEKQIIKKFHIAAYGMDDVAQLGISYVTKEAIKRVDPSGNRSIHISFDIDGIDSFEAPSTGVAVPGGLTAHDGVQIIDEIYRTGRLTAMDLVEVNPEIGSAEDVLKTLMIGEELCMAACGYQRSAMTPPPGDKTPFRLHCRDKNRENYTESKKIKDEPV